MKIESRQNEQIQQEKPARLNKSAGNPDKASLNGLGQVANKKSGSDFEAVLKNTTQTNDLPEDKNLRRNLDQTQLSHEPKKDNNLLTDTSKAREEYLENKAFDREQHAETEKIVADAQQKYMHSVSEQSVPNGRSILHIADLERIISKIRAYRVGKDKQIYIELKRSIFDGLKLKLTFDENNNVKAEFIAADELVKSQINERTDELAELLKDRGVKLAAVKVSIAQSDQH